MHFCMLYGAAALLLTANFCASSAPKAESRISVPVKPKREASLSTSSGYHGPSYKYLPPPSAAANSYNSYNSHGSSSLATGFGTSGSAGIGYDFGAPKVETYIVQTEPAYSGHASGSSSSSHGSASYGGGGSHHFAGVHGVSSGSSVGGNGYRYSSVGPHFSAGGSNVLAHSSHSGGGSGGSNYRHLTKTRPHIQTFIIPASSLAHSVGTGSSAGSAGHHGSHFGAGGNGGGYQYTPSFDSALHSSAGGGSGFGSIHNNGFSGATFSGHSSGSNSVSYKPQQGYSYGGADIDSTLSYASHGSHSAGEYAHSAPPSIPSTSYGVPAGPAVTTYHQGAGVGAGHSYHRANADDTPAYAVGHKGLGHFGFSASKPQALNTNFIASSSSSHGEHSTGRAPFKPSTLLGTTYEVSAPGAQYLPPTSSGYDYQTQAVLHDGATAVGSASAHVNQPDSAYLPPVSRPGSSYLPPHHH